MGYFVDPIGKLLGSWAENVTIWSVILRFLCCFILAGIIGCERARKRHSAGLRTFILASVSACSAMTVDCFLFSNSNAAATSLNAAVASTYLFSFGKTFLPVLSAAALVGIAIISSNSLFYSSKNQIKGLTTSIALFSVVFIGLALGCGFYTGALVIFALQMMCLAVLPAMEKSLKDNSNHFEIHLELKTKNDLQNFISTVRMIGMIIDEIEMNPAYVNSGLSVYTVSLTVNTDKDGKRMKHEEIIDAFSALEYVSFVCEI